MASNVQRVFQDLSNKKDVGNVAQNEFKQEDSEVRNEEKTNRTQKMDEKKTKYVVVIFDSSFHRFYNKENVKFVNFNKKKNNLNKLSQMANYHNEMLIFAHDHCLNPESGCSSQYENLLSICNEWMKLRPNGQINLIRFSRAKETIQKPTPEMMSLITKSKRFILHADREHEELELIAAMNRHWTSHILQLVSEEIKQQYFDY